MPRFLLVLVLLAAGCAAPDDGVPPTPRGGLSPDAERDFIKSAEPSDDYPLNSCVVTREER